MTYSLSQYFVHSKHVDFIDAKYCPEASVTHDFPSVTRVLQLVAFNVDP
jgi:hypothetical protein